jgi:hypothetical protein
MRLHIGAGILVLSVAANGCTAGYVTWAISGIDYAPAQGNSAVVAFYKTDDVTHFQTNVNFNEPGHKGRAIFSFDPVTAAPAGDNTDAYIPEGDYNAFLWEMRADGLVVQGFVSAIFHHNYENRSGCTDTFTGQQTPCSIYKLVLGGRLNPGMPVNCPPPTVVSGQGTILPLCLNTVGG